MRIRDDEQFEAYLQRFRPLAPAPLPGASGYAAHRLSIVAKWALAGAALVAVVAVSVHFGSRATRAPKNVQGVAPGGRATTAQPLTMRGAAALLGRASSVKAALDDVAFQPSVIPISREKEGSALAVLSKEESKQ